SRALKQAGSLPGGNLYFDVDLTDVGVVSILRQMLTAKRVKGRTIFGVPKGVRASIVQAYALGATDLIPLPMENGKFAERLAEALRVIKPEQAAAAAAAPANTLALTEGA